MKDLKCALAECEHNAAYCCCANKIDVNPAAGCNTYKPNSQKRKSIFEMGEDFAKRNYDVDTNVHCDADCIFNKSCICTANGITVLGDNSTDAVCATFMKR